MMRKWNHSNGEITIWYKVGRKASPSAFLIRSLKGMRDKLLIQLRQEDSRQSKEQVQTASGGNLVGTSRGQQRGRADEGTGVGLTSGDWRWEADLLGPKQLSQGLVFTRVRSEATGRPWTGEWHHLIQVLKESRGLWTNFYYVKSKQFPPNTLGVLFVSVLSKLATWFKKLFPF